MLEEVGGHHHCDIDLVEFSPLFTSLKLEALARQQVDSNVYQVRLRYFGGLGKVERLRNLLDLPVVDVIRHFFTGIFNNPENGPIDDCVCRARSLYVTVRSKFPLKPVPGTTDKPTDKGGDSVPYNESIVACINFALLGDNGFYINWLATSNEDISPRNMARTLLFFAKKCHGRGTIWHFC
jgi:hypothetical protein